jgi:HK97 family phage portal protein
LTNSNISETLSRDIGRPKITFFQRIQNSIKAFSLRFSVSDFDKLIEQAWGGKPTAAGVDVGNDSALSFSAVFNAVAIIAGTVASLPLILYRRIGERGKERVKDHPLFDILHNVANPEMTSFLWREVSQSHLLLWGNAYSWIQRDGLGRILALWPLSPEQMTVKRNPVGQIVYELDEGGGKKQILAPRDILHIPGLGFDGRVGYPILTLAREAMGLGLGMEQFQARFYGQGTNLGAVLQHPGRLGQEALDHLKESLKEKYSGLQKSHGVLILEEGMKYERMGMPLEDAQFLESRTFQVAEIARWFNIPPHKLKEMSRATFSNIEQQQIEFVQDCIRPWLVRWEQQLAWKCLLPEERKDLFMEFMIDALLRGDTISRNQALALQRQNGIITANEWRGIENMNPQEGKAGDMLWMPLNYLDANAEGAGERPPAPIPTDKELEPKNGDKKEEKQHLMQSLGVGA